MWASDQKDCRVVVRKKERNGSTVNMQEARGYLNDSFAPTNRPGSRRRNHVFANESRSVHIAMRGAQSYQALRDRRRYPEWYRGFQDCPKTFYFVYIACRCVGSILLAVGVVPRHFVIRLNMMSLETTLHR